MPSARTRWLQPLTDAYAAAGIDPLEGKVPPPTRWARSHPQTIREDDVQRQVEGLLDFLGWRVHHEVDSRRSPVGLPDLVCVRPPRLVVLELKRAAGVLTEAQRAWLTDLDRAGVEAAVVGPADVEVLAVVMARPGMPLPLFDPGPEPILTPAEVRAQARLKASRRRGAARGRAVGALQALPGPSTLP